MRRQIIKHEWKLLRGDGALWVALSLLFVLTLYAAYNGSQWRQLIVAAPQNAQANEMTEFAALRQEAADIASGKIIPKPEADFGKPDYHRDVRDPYITGYYGKVVAVLPPAPLLGLCIGQADLHSSYYVINTRPRHELMTFAKTAEIENPLHLLIGNFDLSFVIVYLFPLLITALMYNLISGERESGTLALALSMPVRLRQIVAGKLALRAGLLLALGVLLPLLAAWWGGSSRAALPRLWLWCLVTLLYGAFWFALALVLAGRQASSANNAVALTGCWLALVVILPALITLAANVLYPIPSRATMLHALRTAEREVAEPSNEETILAEFAAEVAPYATADVRHAIQRRPDTLRDYARRAAISRRLTALEQRFDAARQGQQRFARRWAFVSPALLTQLLLSDVAGSNAERFEQFTTEVASFHANRFAFFTGKLLHGAHLTLDDINSLSPFVWQEESAGQLVKRLGPGLAALFVLTLVLAAWARNRVRRYSLAQ